LLIIAAWLVLAAPEARAQGVFTPAPGSAPAAAGPTSVNPSAAVSSTNPSAHNPSAAVSSTNPNVMNRSATPSTFAPQLSAPTGRTVLPRGLATRRPVVRARERAHKTVRERRQERTAQQAAARQKPAPESARMRGARERANAIMGSVCRGC
jgi:hypothetical protein